MATIAGSPTSSYRLRAPTPAGAKRWRHQEQWHERPGVAQFIYLSMLLHAIAILLFGAPAGGIREGRAMWGSLNVVLQGPARDVAIPPRMETLPAPLPLPRLERELKPAQKRTAPPVHVPIPVPPAIERIAPPPLKLDKALPTPRIEVLPLPAEAPPVIVPAPLQPLVDLPRVERAIAETPKIAAPLAQPVAPPVPPVAPPVQLAPVETPALPSIPAAPALPALERAPEIAAPPRPATPEPAAPPKVERPAPAPAAREEAAPREPAFRAPAPVPAPVETRRGDPNYDPTRPAIDLDEARRRASQMAREGTGQRALLPFPMPAPPERKTKTEEALEKARKPDCRTAYKELGLIAVVPLIANEFGEGTCRW